MNNIIKNIRKNNLKKLFGFSISAIVSYLIFFISLFAIADGDSIIWLLLLIMGIIGGILTFACYKTLIIIIDPYKSDVFKKYGSLENLKKILEEIENTIEFDDKNITISKNYIADKKDYEKIVACDDILRVHKLIHKTNFVVDRINLVITDKYDTEITYSYKPSDEQKVDKLILLIGSKCKNAKLGYTKSNEQYVQQNKQKLPQINLNDISSKNNDNYEDEYFICPDCNNIVEKGDKFCRNCSCKLNWE